MRHLSIVAAATLLSAPLAAQSTPPTQPQPPAPTAARAPASTGYGAWFGSRPSMDDTGGGVLIEAVTEGSPAALGGVRLGDLLVRMGKREIADLSAMTEVLRAHKPGDTLEVVVRRGTEVKTLRVVLGVRP